MLAKIPQFKNIARQNNFKVRDKKDEIILHRDGMAVIGWSN
jgi:hypothetical protein